MTVTTDEAILEAALQQIAITGVRRTSTDDIARRAGVNRVDPLSPVRRPRGGPAGGVHPGDRARARHHRGGHRRGARSRDAAASIPPTTSSNFFSVTIRTLRENRILRQLLEADREETLVSLTFDAGETLSGLLGVLRGPDPAAARTPRPGAADDDLEAVSVTLARLAQSLLLTQDAPPSLRTRAQMRSYAEMVIVPMVLPR